MKNKKYETYSHAKTRLRYHIIFSTKYRNDCLNNIRNEVLNSFDYAQKHSDFKILQKELDKNHIHLLVKFKPSLSIYQVVRRAKQLSNFYLFKYCNQYLKKFYWKKNKIWTNGYFCSTLGEVSENTIIEYIKNQG